jgi:hypothetical protein
VVQAPVAAAEFDFRSSPTRSAARPAPRSHLRNLMLVLRDGSACNCRIERA